MKKTVSTLAASSIAAFALSTGACSSNPVKVVTEAMEAVAVEAEKANGDCDKFVAAAKPIAEKNAAAFKNIKEQVKGEGDEAMKKYAEYAPRLAEVRKKLRVLKTTCRKHEGTRAVMQMLRGK